MCQLLGMNCNTPTDIGFSFAGFSKRGGLTDHHTDGFGIGFFEGRGLRLFLDDKPSAQSPVAELVRNYHLKSENVIAHIRKASQGINSLQAFCYLPNRLRAQFPDRPCPNTLFDALAELCAEIRQHGMFNFILSDGRVMYAHASTLLYYITRQPPFGQAHLIDEDMAIDFAKVTTPNDRVTVITTLPLTDNETWQQFACDELMMFDHGKLVRRHRPENPVYLTQEEGLEIARKAGVSV